uniref:C2H2-type domain-containing protein n=1 Tax=Steinernema glaseri TaxID=37863 RepID=A0A1I7YBW7_9BILA
MPYEEVDEEYVPRPSEGFRPLENWKVRSSSDSIHDLFASVRRLRQGHQRLVAEAPPAYQGPRRVENTLSCARLYNDDGRQWARSPSLERLEMQRQLDRLYSEALGLERTYFPPRNRLTPEETPVAPSCRSCGQRIASLRQRRSHIGTHRSLEIPCPFRSCSYSGCLRPLEKHIQNKHGRKIRYLSEEERERFKDSRRLFYEEADAVMEEYFD